MKELISIIVPVYNVENYVERCIVSLTNQTYKNVEIIIIDDGSTDGSGEICDCYAQRDNRVKVFHKLNGGLSDARNYGIERSKGEFITFVDSDDYVSVNYIENLYKEIISANADIAICKSKLVYDEKHLIEKADLVGVQCLERKEAIIKVLNIEISHSAWGKLYKRFLFDEIRFPVGKLYEDLAIMYDVLLKSNKVVVLDSCAYMYLIRSGSIMRTEFNERQLDELTIIDEVARKVETVYPNLKNIIEARRIYSYFIVLKRILMSENKNKYIRLRKEIRKKIVGSARMVLFGKQIKIGIKIKIISYLFGEQTYMCVQGIADRRNKEII